MKYGLSMKKIREMIESNMTEINTTINTKVDTKISQSTTWKTLGTVNTSKTSLTLPTSYNELLVINKAYDVQEIYTKLYITSMSNGFEINGFNISNNISALTVGRINNGTISNSNNQTLNVYYR